MKKRIRKATVIGSGIMGAGIACHLANIGVSVLLLDVRPKAPSEEEKAKGKDANSKTFRNKIAQENLKRALKSKPAPLYQEAFVDRIQVGNLEDDLPKIADSDWIIEVVVERLDIKQQLFTEIEKYRTSGTLISSNTSGIPIHLMAEGRTEDFKKHFLGTHFFNPPRYLKLLEIIPTPDTKKEVIDFFVDYGQRFLGKTPVVCQDTPAFIANRIGIFSIMNLFHQVKETGLDIETIDKLTGPIIGRPKSATFRTADVVGLDTLVHVANGLYKAAPNDEQREVFKLPDYISRMMQENRLGSKTDIGFYKKTKNQEGKTEILVLDLDTFEYRPAKKISFATINAAKEVEDLDKRYKVLIDGSDIASNFYKKSFAGLFSYVSFRIGEITDAIYKVDDAMRAGFGWEHGPFEIWDKIGLEKGLKLIENEGYRVAPWVKTLLSEGKTSFYKTNEKSQTTCIDFEKKSYEIIPGKEAFINLDNYRDKKTLWKNDGASLINLGDGILNLEFHSKMNSIGAEVIEGVHKALDIAEKDYDGLVLANQGANFSVGANLMMIFMLAAEQEYDELEIAIQTFQKTTMRLRYSSIPVIVAPHNMALGGGCETLLHGDVVVAHAESYIGLVETGVGLIPGGGGTKEMALRTADMYQKGDVEINHWQESFLNIAMGKVSTSAYEAEKMGFLRKGQDKILVNKDLQIATAKKQALFLAENGYTQAEPRKNIRVLGRQLLSALYVGIEQMVFAKYISDYDALIAKKLAYAMAGGDLTAPQQVSEQYLLDLERESFISLCGEKKTLERIQFMLQKGKPLRN